MPVFFSAVLQTGIIIFLLQVLFYVFAALFKTDKLTDISYSLTFIAAVSALLFYARPVKPADMVLASMVFIWAIRLGSYLFLRILTIKKDNRFDSMRGSWLRFASFWSLQAVTILLVMLPVIAQYSSDPMRGGFIFYLAGGVLWTTGFITESVADYQKSRFHKTRRSPEQFIKSGLWKYSRHPNFFGEAQCWWGIFIFTIPVLHGWLWLSLIGPVFITVLLLFVSGVPTVEEQAEKKYGHLEAYQVYKSNTPVFFPKLFR